MKVRNIESYKGNATPNQFIIEDRGVTYFQSYNSIIVKIDKGEVFLDEKYWNYSKTTGKYRNIFLGEDKKEIERKIKEGTYTLINLNE